MADVWYPKAIAVTGALNANYANGRNRMEVVKRHYTVGVNSWGVGFRGYFQWLVNRDASIYQFAPVDAYCFDSGEWNDAGPGIEVEYHPSIHDVMFTSETRASTGELVQWLHHEHGFPLDAWPGGRIDEWTGFRGFLDHRDLVQTEQHTDFWSDEDWDAMTEEAMGLDLTKPEDLTVWRNKFYDQEGVWPTIENGQPVTIDYHEPVLHQKLDQILAAVRGGATGVGVAEDRIREIVREELDRTKLGT